MHWVHKAVFGLLILITQPMLIRADQTGCKVCLFEEPELWVINSRNAPKCQCLDEGFEKLTYHRFDKCTQKFVAETRESFLRAQSNIPTMLFSHGNSLKHEAAMESCAMVYTRLRICPGPKMLVFWSWPSEIYYNRPLIRPILLAKSNIRIKYVFAEHQGYYIAKLVNMMSTAQPLTLCGHSYGGVTVISALHFLGGGSIDQLSPPACICKIGTRCNVRAALISAAFDCDALQPGQRYDRAMDTVEQLYNTYNDSDATLKRWPTHSLRGQQAIGFTGLCAHCLGENCPKVMQDHLTSEVGRSHYITEHLESCTMMRSVCRLAFEQELPFCPRKLDKSTFSPGADLDLQRVLELPATTLFPGLAL